MRLTIPHYFDFGPDRTEVGSELTTPGAWDGLRTRTSGPFAMASDPAEWSEQAKAKPELRSRAAAVIEVCESLEARSLVSYGVGGAVLEYWLQRADDLDLTVTEFAPETISRLEGFFPDATVLHHDLLRDAPLPGDVHLFHRIDTEFSNKELKGVMKRFSNSTVILVATSIIGWPELVSELRQRRNSHASRAGVSRSEQAFRSLWRRTHVSTPARFHDLQGWVLVPRESAAAR